MCGLLLSLQHCSWHWGRKLPGSCPGQLWAPCLPGWVRGPLTRYTRGDAQFCFTNNKIWNSTRLRSEWLVKNFWSSTEKSWTGPAPLHLALRCLAKAGGGRWRGATGGGRWWKGTFWGGTSGAVLLDMTSVRSLSNTQTKISISRWNADGLSERSELVMTWQHMAIVRESWGIWTQCHVL